MRNSVAVFIIPLALWGVTVVHCASNNATTNNSTDMLAAAASGGYARYAMPPAATYDDQQPQPQAVDPSNIIRRRHMYSYEDRPVQYNDNSKLTYEDTSASPAANKYYSPRVRSNKNRYDNAAVVGDDKYNSDQQPPAKNNKYFAPSSHYINPKKTALAEGKPDYAQEAPQNQVADNEADMAHHQRPAGYEIVTTIVNEDLGLSRRPQRKQQPAQYVPERAPQYASQHTEQPALPADNNNEVIQHDSYKLPSCAKNEHSTFCLHDYYYPHKKIQHAIDTNTNGFLKLYAEVAPEDEEQSHQFFKKDEYSDDDDKKNSPYFGRMCNAHVAERAKLKRARNARGQWQIIVQARGYEQSVRLEQCKGYKHDCCNYVDELRYDSECVQKKSLQRLVIYDPSLYSNKYDIPFKIDIFSLPSCCSCQIDPYSAGRKQRKCGSGATTTNNKREEALSGQQQPESAATPVSSSGQPQPIEAPPPTAAPPPQQQQQPDGNTFSSGQPQPIEAAQPQQQADIQPVVTENKDKQQIVIDVGYAGPEQQQQQIQKVLQQQQQQQQQQTQQEQLQFPPGPPPDAKFASREPPVPLTEASQPTLPEQPAETDDHQQQIQKRTRDLPVTDTLNEGLSSGDGY